MVEEGSCEDGSKSGCRTRITLPKLYIILTVIRGELTFGYVKVLVVVVVYSS